MIKLKKSLTVI